MTSRRKLPWSLALLLTFATATAFAEPSASPSAGTSPAVCASVESSEAQVSEAPPSEAELAGLVCSIGRCTTVEDCWNACPNASSAACTRNACSYTYPGGGGGGGPTCPSSRCIEDSDCSCKGTPGSCVNRACVY
ncbi:hypothetical protein D7Y13_35255 [Corallococcus praedator]|uniref:Latent transforming growth factor beta-binding protein n=1 Tax=Corallococcus praedator TaxID=2316724 RepID=A0ABX9Q6W4_9BACT|nr:MULTISPECIES: hypothetical protein [Corallococcus]RKH20683.1 hypothetical protein D7X75_37610 [Corallococcus sp. CA031C]RKH92835.1 hypothetical protein D7Y13_35255 [Corallococcus praedator]